MNHNTKNLRVKKLTPLITPDEISEKLPANSAIYDLVRQTRQQVEDTLTGKSDKLIVVVGPCSIHDPKGALDYATRLQKLAERYRDELCIIMRVYFEKPRTTIGWKGLINDPKLNNTFMINEGLEIARKLLIDINALGVPTGTEFLDTIIPQYISDLISWAAIGARTTESQIHREMSSGLSMPIGFKNGTQGNIDVAVDALFAAKHSHHFLGVSSEGKAAIISTMGNPNCHIILRGGKKTGPNYSDACVKETAKALHSKQLATKIMVDCSHGNSEKNHEKQLSVVDDLCQQLQQHNYLLGLMIESNIISGTQPLTQNAPLEYGKSITDACIDWHDTEIVLKKLSDAVKLKRGDA